MSTVAEIEAAIEHLPANEKLRLRQRLLARPVAPLNGRPKTGAELAGAFSARFHLRPDEADAFAAEMSAAKNSPARTPSWE